MKKLVKIFVVAVFALGFGVTAQAQNGQGSNSINATATVLGNIEVEGATPLSFGQVMPGFSKYVPMIDGVNGVVSNSGGTVNSLGVTSGLFKIFAAPGSSIAIGFEVEPMMSGDAELALDFNKGLSPTGTETTVAWSTGGDGASVTELRIESTNTIASFPTAEIETDKNGIYVYVGGTVRPTSTQANGTYTGSLTLRATYN